MPQLTVSFDRHSIVCQLIDPPPPELAEPGYLLHLYTPQIKHSFQQLGDITGDGEKQSGVGRDHTRSLQCNYPGQGLCVGFWWLMWWRVHVGAGNSTPNEFLIAAFDADTQRGNPCVPILVEWCGFVRTRHTITYGRSWRGVTGIVIVIPRGD